MRSLATADEDSAEVSWMASFYEAANWHLQLPSIWWAELSRTPTLVSIVLSTMLRGCECSGINREESTASLAAIERG